MLLATYKYFKNDIHVYLGDFKERKMKRGFCFGRKKEH